MPLDPSDPNIAACRHCGALFERRQIDAATGRQRRGKPRTLYCTPEHKRAYLNAHWADGTPKPPRARLPRQALTTIRYADDGRGEAYEQRVEWTYADGTSRDPKAWDGVIRADWGDPKERIEAHLSSLEDAEGWEDEPDEPDDALRRDASAPTKLTSRDPSQRGLFDVLRSLPRHIRRLPLPYAITRLRQEALLHDEQKYMVLADVLDHEYMTEERRAEAEAAYRAMVEQDEQIAAVMRRERQAE